jgi:hypothetical protein
MHGMMIAPYVLRAQQQRYLNDEDFLAAEVDGHSRAREVLLSLAAGFAGVSACFVAFAVFA